MHRLHTVLAILALPIAVPALAQLSVPSVGGTVGGVLGRVDRALDPLEERVGGLAERATRLADARVSRLAALVRRNRDSIEIDKDGQPARKGELLLMGASEADLAAAERAGFTVLGRERLGELDIAVVRLGVPTDTSLARAEANLQALLPNATIAADSLHFPAGTPARGAGAATPRAAPRSSGPIDTPVGLIDGAPGPATKVGALRGFARGAPLASRHGSATASLLALAGVRRILVADVYGADPAGGNALAISRGIDWLTGQGVRVISISLAGPNNALLGQAVAAARRRGVLFVAAVGNDGPAAPPAYPASYPGVLAVTGVDGRNRALIEAGRASHLDYAAPGADMLAADAGGKWVRVRGTSYAAPLVAARAAAASGAAGGALSSLDREAADLGAKGPDAVYGRGLLCGACARRR
ncbi:MAG TPA: S8 family serine peptidase [Novosphingobium sp.]